MFGKEMRTHIQILNREQQSSTTEGIAELVLRNSDTQQETVVPISEAHLTTPTITLLVLAAASLGLPHASGVQGGV